MVSLLNHISSTLSQRLVVASPLWWTSGLPLPTYLPTYIPSPLFLPPLGRGLPPPPYSLYSEPETRRRITFMVSYARLLSTYLPTYPPHIGRGLPPPPYPLYSEPETRRRITFMVGFWSSIRPKSYPADGRPGASMALPTNIPTFPASLAAAMSEDQEPSSSSGKSDIGCSGR